MSACRVTLTPEDRGQGVSRVQVRIELDGFGQKAGHTVMKAQLRTVGVPGAEPAWLASRSAMARSLAKSPRRAGILLQERVVDHRENCFLIHIFSFLFFVTP